MARAAKKVIRKKLTLPARRSFDRTLLVIILFVSLAMLAIVVSAAYDFVDPQVKRRQIEASNVNAVALSLLKTFVKRVENGELTEKQAQAEAIAFLSSAKFTDGYLWVSEVEGNFRFHPQRLDLVDKPIRVLKDFNGVPFYYNLALDAKNGVRNSRAMSVPTADPNVSRQILIQVDYFAPWDWVLGINLPDVEFASALRTFLVKYGMIVAIMVMSLIIPVLFIRFRIKAMAGTVSEVFRAITYSQPLPKMKLKRTPDELGDIVEAYDLLVEAELFRDNSFNKVQDARRNPLVRTVIETTHVVDKLAQDLLKAGRYLSRIDFDEAIFTIEKSCDHLSRVETNIKEVLLTARELESRINSPIFLSRDRTLEIERARDAVKDLEESKQRLGILSKNTQAFVVRAGLGALGSVLTALKGQMRPEEYEKKREKTAERLQELTEDVRSMAEQVEVEISAVSPKIASGVDALQSYDDLVKNFELALVDLRKSVRDVPQQIGQMKDAMRLVNDNLAQVKQNVSDLRIDPSKTSAAGFARDTLAIAKRSQRARVDIERTLRFGKR